MGVSGSSVFGGLAIRIEVPVPLFLARVLLPSGLQNSWVNGICKFLLKKVGTSLLKTLAVILQSSMLQRFTAESSRDLSALRKLNNKQASIDVPFLLFKLLTQLPFVSFLFSLLPFSILSLLPLPHPFFLF